MPEWCYTEFYQWLDEDNAVEWLYIGALYWNNEPWKFALNLGILPISLLLSWVVLLVPESYPRFEGPPIDEVDDYSIIWYHLVIFIS